MLAARFKQATASSMVTIGPLLREKTPYIIINLAVKDFRSSDTGWINGLKSDTLLCTNLYLGNL